MNYGFYLAEIVETATIDDNRLRVRILPQMEGINSNMCPLYPSFFRDSQYFGKVGDFVWVICDDEFSLGYVFGLANYNTYPDRTKVDGESIYEVGPNNEMLSIPQSLRKSINESVSSVDLNYLDMSDAKVEYWDGNCIHYVERATGSKIIAYSNGTFYIMRPDAFLMKIGDSVIKVESGSISFSTGGKNAAIKLQSDYVGLGKNPVANLMVNDGKSAEGAVKSNYVFA